MISFDKASDPPGHVVVVTASDVDGNGNGTITTMTQNDTPDGRRTLSVSNWRVASFSGFVPYGWLHDPAGRGGGGGPTDRLPFGSAKASSASGHTVDVRGWTIDPDTPRTPTNVVVIISGKKPSPFTIRLKGTAGIARPDVATRYPTAGPYHGFDLGTTLKRAQTVQIKVVAPDTTDPSRTVIRSTSLAVP